jgi:hypothetical protein
VARDGDGAVSEYQCHGFVALDRPLTAKQMAELRAIFRRTEISPRALANSGQANHPPLAAREE